MRNYILTEQERRIIKEYVENDVKLEGLSVLRNRIKKNIKTLQEDMSLLQKLLEKWPL